MAPVFCFSGSIGSGKSSVSKVVAERLNCKRAGFGDYVRHLVEQDGGDPTSREQLQDFGQSCVETDTPKFCKGLLRFVDFQPPEQLVIDGIRHGSVLKELVRILIDQPVYLLHLSADPAIRSMRIADRGDSTAGLRQALSHPVELESENFLQSVADVVIDANQSAELVFADALKAVSGLSEK